MNTRSKKLSKSESQPTSFLILSASVVLYARLEARAFALDSSNGILGSDGNRTRWRKVALGPVSDMVVLKGNEVSASARCRLSPFIMYTTLHDQSFIVQSQTMHDILSWSWWSNAKF